MRLLLDTCVLFDFAEQGLPEQRVRQIEAAASMQELFISAVSEIEISILTGPTKSRPLRLIPNVEGWFKQILTATGGRLHALSSGAIYAAGRLPAFHKDPFDRLLMAVANELNAPLMTCDTVLPRYEQAGLVRLLRY